MRVNELYMSLHYLKRSWSRLVWHQTPDRDMSSVIDMTLSFNNEEFPWLNFVAISLQLTRHDSSVVRFLQLGRRQCSKKMFDDVILCRSGLHSLSRLILTFIYIEHFEQDNKFFSIMENIRNMKGRKKRIFNSARSPFSCDFMFSTISQIASQSQITFPLPTSTTLCIYTARIRRINGENSREFSSTAQFSLCLSLFVFSVCSPTWKMRQHIIISGECCINSTVSWALCYVEK